jgi:hypothetical protein
MIDAAGPRASIPGFRAACALALALLASSVAAQSPQPKDSAAADPRLVQPERPTIATHAGTVARGFVELEDGVEWDNVGTDERSFFAPTNLKIGLASNAQLNILVNLIQDRLVRNGKLTPGDLTIGVKYRLVEDDRVLGDFAILPAIKLPTAAEGEGGTGTTDFSLLLISSRQLGSVAMDLNAGVTRRSGNGSSAPINASIWTASFGIPISGPLGAALELFGYPGTAGPAGEKGSASILVGPTFLLRKWLALDAGIISPLTGPQAHAVYAGFVWNAGPVPGTRHPVPVTAQP